jgi:hypothetical protein
MRARSFARCPLLALNHVQWAPNCIADLWSTGFACSSSSTTWNDVPFELKHRARLGCNESNTHDELARG